MSSPEGVSPGPTTEKAIDDGGRGQDALIAQEDFEQSWPGFDLAGAPQLARRILDRATVRLKVLGGLDRDDARQSDAPVTDLDLR